MSRCSTSWLKFHRWPHSSPAVRGHAVIFRSFGMSFRTARRAPGLPRVGLVLFDQPAQAKRVRENRTSGESRSSNRPAPTPSRISLHALATTRTRSMRVEDAAGARRSPPSTRYARYPAAIVAAARSFTHRLGRRRLLASATTAAPSRLRRSVPSNRRNYGPNLSATRCTGALKAFPLMSHSARSNAPERVHLLAAGRVKPFHVHRPARCTSIWNGFLPIRLPAHCSSVSFDPPSPMPVIPLGLHRDEHIALVEQLVQVGRLINSTLLILVWGTVASARGRRASPVAVAAVIDQESFFDSSTFFLLAGSLASEPDPALQLEEAVES